MNCTGLTSLTIEATTPPTLGEQMVFKYLDQETWEEGILPNLTIYVPASALSDYQNDWSEYASIIQAIPNN